MDLADEAFDIAERRRKQYCGWRHEHSNNRSRLLRAEAYHCLGRGLMQLSIAAIKEPSGWYRVCDNETIAWLICRAEYCCDDGVDNVFDASERWMENCEMFLSRDMTTASGTELYPIVQCRTKKALDRTLPSYQIEHRKRKPQFGPNIVEIIERPRWPFIRRF